MIHGLEIANFYSIRDPQVIDLRAADNAPDEPGRLAPLWQGATERAPKVVALFGANASGKSNVLKALTFVKWLLRDSFTAPLDDHMPFDRFNDPVMRREPTRLGIHTAGLEDIGQADDPDAPRCRYFYEVTIGGGTTPVIDSELLYYWPSSASRRVKLFERSGDGVSAAKAFGLSGFRQALDKTLRPKASTIATLAQLKHPFAASIWQTAGLVLHNIHIARLNFSDEMAVRHYNDHPILLEELNRELPRIDLGIDSIRIQQGANGPVAWFSHHGMEEPIPMVLESEGTRQFIRIYPLLLGTLQRGGLAVVDELDSAIHPLLLPEILRWFHDPERNPHDAQLWMSCHNASLLEDLIKEEVFFCEKDRGGRTQVYGLRDIQSVRRTDNYYRKYLGGAFGAVPQIG